MKTKRFTILFLKLFRLRNDKRKVLAKDSIRPMKTNTVYPEGYVEPSIFECKDGTKIPYGFKNFPDLKEAIKNRLEKIPFSDAIDNSH